jgi:uncharacterized membrane protein YdcZ (DUF606 family)
MNNENGNLMYSQADEKLLFFGTHFLGRWTVASSVVKNPEIGRFLFFLAHILAYMIFACLLPEVHNHP